MTTEIQMASGESNQKSNSFSFPIQKYINDIFFEAIFHLYQTHKIDATAYSFGFVSVRR